VAIFMREQRPGLAVLFLRRETCRHGAKADLARATRGASKLREEIARAVARSEAIDG
jgi:hypothetical protein